MVKVLWLHERVKNEGKVAATILYYAKRVAYQLGGIAGRKVAEV